MGSLQALLLVTALSGVGETVLLDFSANWCGPCRSMEPTIQRLTAEGYPVRKIDIDQHPQLARQFNVTGVPCFVMLANGQEVDRLEGATSHARLRQMFETAHFRPSGQGSEQVRGQSPEPSNRLGLFGGRRLLGGESGEPRRPAPTAAPADTLQPVQAPPRAAAPHNSNQQIPPQQNSPQNTMAQSAAPQSAAPQNAQPQFQPVPAVAVPATAMPSAAAPADATASTAVPAAGDVQQRALHATVRLRVDDPQGHSYGTGTIIDRHGEEALIVTCGHIFRDSQGQGTIHVDLFAPGANGPVQGQLIAYDADERDIALVSIRPGIPVPSVRVAPPEYPIAAGASVFSIGCDRGADPSIRPSRITSVDKYLGAPNIEVAGQPVDGRSGGGLFSAEGFLIGICNAADPEDNEGIYAALRTVHWQLDQIGQQRVYQSELALAEGSASASNEVTSTPQNPLPNTAQPASDHPPLVPVTAAVHSESTGTGDAASEVICIVRDAQGQRRVLTLDQPSPELLELLRRESAQRQLPRAGASSASTAAGPTAQTPASRGARQGLAGQTPHHVAGSTVVRGQSTDRY